MGDDKDKDVDFHWPADMETKEEALYLPIRPSTHSSSISPSINSTIIFRARVIRVNRKGPPQRVTGRTARCCITSGATLYIIVSCELCNV